MRASSVRPKLGFSWMTWGVRIGNGTVTVCVLPRVTCMHRLLGVSESYLRVRSLAPFFCHDGASAYRYVAAQMPPEHRLHATVRAINCVWENPKSLDAHTWIPPRSYYRRRSRVFWTTRSSCRLLLSMVRTPFERPDILFCRLPHTNLGREMNHLRQAARQRVPASKLVKSADPLELRSPADAVHFRVEEHLQEQLGATAIHRSPHGATKRHKLSP